MPACPTCLGDGSIDFRDENAEMLEHFTHEYLRAAGYNIDLAVLECDECEGTGVVSPEREADLYASARASVDQVLARLRDQLPLR